MHYTIVFVGLAGQEKRQFCNCNYKQGRNKRWWNLGLVNDFKLIDSISYVCAIMLNSFFFFKPTFPEHTSWWWNMQYEKLNTTVAHYCKSGYLCVEEIYTS